MTDQIAEPQTFRLPGLALQAPAQWERVDAPGVDLKIVAPHASDQTDAPPSLVVVTEPSTASIQQLSSRMIASALAGATPSYVVACDLWDAGDHWGRRIELTHRVDSEQINVITHLLTAPGRALELTFSSSVGARSDYAQVANGIAASVQVTQEG